MDLGTLSPFTSELEARLAGRFGSTVLTPTDVRFAADRDGFVTVAKILDLNTGRLVPVDAKIHVGDTDWLIRLHQDRFDLDWKLDEAEREQGGRAAWPACALGDGETLVGRG